MGRGGSSHLECVETIAVLTKCAPGLIEINRGALFRPSYVKDGISGNATEQVYFVC